MTLVRPERAGGDDQRGLRDAPVQTSFAPSTHSKRKPLEKSKLFMAVKSQRAARHKPVRAPSDDSEFYTNIWSLEPEVGIPATAEDEEEQKRKKKKDKKKKGDPRLVDISQVAHVLTTVIDYKDGYEAPTENEIVNIWADPNADGSSKSSIVSYSSAPSVGGVGGYAPVPSRAAALHSRYTSNVSIVISEHDSEEDSDDADDDDQRLIQRLVATANGPLSMNIQSMRNKLRREMSEENLSRVTSIPISGPQRKGDSVVFSTVLAKHEDVDMSWNSQFLLGMHEPVRHALFVIDRFLERRQGNNAVADWNVGEFFQWFKEYFVAFVRNQHDVKSQVLLPLLAVKFTEKREIMACYEAIFVLLDDILAQEKKLVAVSPSEEGSWQEGLQALQADIRRLNFLLFHVLTLEEETLKPALGDSFTEKTFLRYVMPRVVRQTHPKRVVIPWIVERCRVWGGDKVARAYRDELPFTARFMYHHAWHPYFVSHIASAMKNLDKEMTGMTGENESWFGCSIQ